MPDRAADYSRSILAGWLVIAVTFGGLILWSFLAPLTAAVMAQGSLVVDSSRKVIQHLEGGIVKEILVHDGQIVGEGEALLRLDQSQVLASAALLRAKLDSALAQEARLMAERSGENVISFPAELISRRTDVEVASTLDTQRRLFEARRSSRNGQIQLLRARIEQSREQILGLTTLEKSLEYQAVLMRKELSGQQILEEKGYSSKNKILSLQRDVARLEGERGQSLASIASIRQTISESDLQILQLDKQFREDVEKELRDVQGIRFDSEERLAAVVDQISRLTVRSPVAGVVMDLAVHTVGGVVAPGGHLMDVVPRDDRLLVEATVSPDSIDGVYVGQPSQVRFSAFNRGASPTVKGEVIFVSADRMVNERTDAPYYIVRIEIDEEGRRQLEQFSLIPGMPCEVVIDKGSRTMAEYFIKPVKDTIYRSMKY
ncbi:HlyD family type I secretion periplasmic adaptor subunit [Magnetospirillum molischianum]|uniref:HlyD family type I secretion periplasmic adaptor subunit n=1 Tax=Magnetospirillum molischianum TaxID=1083 RepID=UPI00138AB70D|nr:HlyD family type I secretion periplasmic adaptor subunit [Magnetospirillum molischianum]